MSEMLARVSKALDDRLKQYALDVEPLDPADLARVVVEALRIPIPNTATDAQRITLLWPAIEALRATGAVRLGVDLSAIVMTVFGAMIEAILSEPTV